MVTLGISVTYFVPLDPLILLFIPFSPVVKEQGFWTVNHGVPVLEIAYGAA